jgi:hypothetical protein
MKKAARDGIDELQWPRRNRLDGQQSRGTTRIELDSQHEKQAFPFSPPPPLTSNLFNLVASLLLGDNKVRLPIDKPHQTF